MNRKALLISSLLAFVSVALLTLYMRKFEREMSGGDMVQLLVTVRPVTRGQVLTDDMLSSREVPLAYVETRAVKSRERSKVIGLPLAASVDAQQTLMWTDLAIHTEHRDLSSLVQPGKRALTIVAGGSSDRRGNALIRPGDYVDVISTMSDPTTGQQTSVVLLQRVLVLAVGSDTQLLDGSGSKSSGQAGAQDRALTLSLNLQEVQLVALAIEQGRLSVAVRPPDEQTVVDDVPDMKASALLDGRQRSQVQQASRVANPIRIEATP
jgi:pilus assembly protein CpaB